MYYVVKMHKLPSAFSLGKPLQGKSVHKLRDQFAPEHNANIVFLILQMKFDWNCKYKVHLWIKAIIIPLCPTSKVPRCETTVFPSAPGEMIDALELVTLTCITVSGI